MRYAYPPCQATGGCGASALSTLRQIKACQNLCGNPLALGDALGDKVCGI